MKIALLFDGLSALGKAPEVQLLDSIEAVESALLEWATEVVRVPVSNDGRWIERVRKGKFDLVFNLCEGIDGEAVYESMVISVLELLGIHSRAAGAGRLLSRSERTSSTRSSTAPDFLCRAGHTFVAETKSPASGFRRSASR